MAQAAARVGSDALALRAGAARVGAALAASVVLHAALAGSLDRLIEEARFGGAWPRAGAALRVTLAPLADPSSPRDSSSAPPAQPGPGTHRDPAVSEPKYFAPAELDRGPGAVSEIEPVYPASGPPGGGTVVARVLINERGAADTVEILRADPPGVFEETVLEAFAAGRYRPGTRGGRPVRSQFTVEVRFHSEDQAR